MFFINSKQNTIQKEKENFDRVTLDEKNCTLDELKKTKPQKSSFIEET